VEEDEDGFRVIGNFALEDALTFVDLVEFVLAMIDFLEKAVDEFKFVVDEVALPCVEGDDNGVGLGGCLVEEDKDGFGVVGNFALEEALIFVDLVEFVWAMVDFFEEAVDEFKFVIDEVALLCNTLGSFVDQCKIFCWR